MLSIYGSQKFHETNAFNVASDRLQQELDWYEAYVKEQEAKLRSLNENIEKQLLLEHYSLDLFHTIRTQIALLSQLKAISIHPDQSKAKTFIQQIEDSIDQACIFY